MIWGSDSRNCLGGSPRKWVEHFCNVCGIISVLGWFSCSMSRQGLFYGSCNFHPIQEEKKVEKFTFFQGMFLKNSKKHQKLLQTNSWSRLLLSTIPHATGHALETTWLTSRSCSWANNISPNNHLEVFARDVWNISTPRGWFSRVWPCHDLIKIVIYFVHCSSRKQPVQPDPNWAASSWKWFG